MLLNHFNVSWQIISNNHSCNAVYVYDEGILDHYLKFRGTGVILRLAYPVYEAIPWRNGLKFGMLIHHSHLHYWSKLGHGWLIFLNSVHFLFICLHKCCVYNFVWRIIGRKNVDKGFKKGMKSVPSVCGVLCVCGVCVCVCVWGGGGGGYFRRIRLHCVVSVQYNDLIHQEASHTIYKYITPTK